MTKIDLKDRKILYELDLNCRQSNTQIGKKVGLKRDVVAYRVKRMQDEGIIKNFWTWIDAYKLGYNVFRVYLVFQYANPDMKKNIIEHFVNYKNSWAVISPKGVIDLAVVIWVKDIHDFYEFWDETLDKYGDYFAKTTFSVFIRAFHYKSSYLLLDEYKKSDREYYEIVGMGKKIEIDETDYNLLNELAVNARAPLIDIAAKLDCSSQTINYRLKNLIKSKVIQAFRTSIDVSKLGLQHYKLDIYLREHKQRKPIMNYIRYNPNLTYIDVSIGFSDLELEFYLENEDKLLKIMEDINSRFPNSIKNYSYFITQNVHKVRFMPEI